jgi:Holliday junction resolvase
MSNYNTGTGFESEIKKFFKEYELISFLTAIPEHFDVLVINQQKTFIAIECKTIHSNTEILPTYREKNLEQLNYLYELSKKIPVLYAIKFISKQESIINFYPLNNMILERYAHYGITKRDIIEYIRNL